MSLSSIDPEDLIEDSGASAQRFLNDYAKMLQQTAANLWRVGPSGFRYPADVTAAHYAIARRALWCASGWNEDDAP